MSGSEKYSLFAGMNFGKSTKTVTPTSSDQHKTAPTFSERKQGKGRRSNNFYKLHMLLVFGIIFNSDFPLSSHKGE